MAEPGNAVITITVKGAIGLIASAAFILSGAAWGLWTLTMGSLQSDVAEIRAAVTKTQDGVVGARDYTRESDAALRTEFSNLTAELRVTNSRLSDLTVSVSRLDSSIQDVDHKLSASVLRQQDFERWVVTRLGPIGIAPTQLMTPEGWGKQQSEIIMKLQEEDDPLMGWYNATLKP
ncbi:hypothetical protein [Microbaculum marinisediminis]|uniref:Uncharacterized protein n=1 Tax=Microbaculum marinisediminis TaxID=2931392 RepID=A0AAW5R149_9HYPH|nr:hypothetical protein [Microbaculum sp. A6E488]MCT8974010.1 hypothetical protein [Microbaculum sp. A6E488]